MSTASSVRDRALVALLSASVIGIILQITLGGVVRVTESGDGCPDWPTCFGRWIPPADYHALLEWSHRTTGVAVGLLVIAAVARILVRHRSNGPLLGTASAALALLVAVGAIGGWVVLSGLDPGLRTAHLGLAEIDLLLAIAALTLAAWPSTESNAPSAYDPRFRASGRLAAIAAAAALFALLSGSYAVWRDAGAVCTSWPMCGGDVIPGSGLVWIHVAHRLFALAAVALAVWAALRALRLPVARGAVRTAAVGVLAISLAQVLVGAANPWSDFSQWARAAHLSLATLLWANASLMAVLIWLPLWNPGRHRGSATVE